jgi:signal transduction histidine kinase
VTQASEGKAYYETQLGIIQKDLKDFIDWNEVKTSDKDKLSEWNQQNWYVRLSVIKDGKVVYDTVNEPERIINIENAEERRLEHKEMDGTAQSTNHLINRKEMKFKDGDATIIMSAFFQAKFQNAINALSLTFIAASFIMVFLLLFHRNMAYIKKIEKGIRIAETGDLEYRIPVKGRDELSSLANSINNMCSELKNKIEIEGEMLNKNRDIVASISHDIRTPLTSVICYLDLISERKFKDEEELHQYIENARVKAYQIKNLSENLFTNSVENKKYEVGYEFEKINANELIFQIILDTQFDLEEAGFEVVVNNELRDQIHINVDITQFRRIFTNMISNILKYAEPEGDIVFATKKTENFLMIRQSNAVKKLERAEDSFGIGIKNCKEIIRNHDGFINIYNDEKNFTIEIGIPIV